MKEELAQLTSQARVFQNSKCALSGAALELPVVHFMCGHSFNLRALPDTEGKECPLCAPGYVMGIVSMYTCCVELLCMLSVYRRYVY